MCQNSISCQTSYTHCLPLRLLTSSLLVNQTCVSKSQRDSCLAHGDEGTRKKRSTNKWSRDSPAGKLSPPPLPPFPPFCRFCSCLRSGSSCGLDCSSPPFPPSSDPPFPPSPDSSSPPPPLESSPPFEEDGDDLRAPPTPWFRLFPRSPLRPPAPACPLCCSCWRNNCCCSCCRCRGFSV